MNRMTGEAQVLLAGSRAVTALLLKCETVLTQKKGQLSLFCRSYKDDFRMEFLYFLFKTNLFMIRSLGFLFQNKTRINE